LINRTTKFIKQLRNFYPQRPYPESRRKNFARLRIIKKLPQNAVIQIASSVWKTGSRDIRDILKIAKLCNPADIEQDISRRSSYNITAADQNGN
jgi:hypothetical protein